MNFSRYTEYHDCLTLDVKICIKWDWSVLALNSKGHSFLP